MIAGVALGESDAGENRPPRGTVLPVGSIGMLSIQPKASETSHMVRRISDRQQPILSVIPTHQPQAGRTVSARGSPSITSRFGAGRGSNPTPDSARSARGWRGQITVRPSGQRARADRWLPNWCVAGRHGGPHPHGENWFSKTVRSAFEKDGFVCNGVGETMFRSMSPTHAAWY